MHAQSIAVVCMVSETILKSVSQSGDHIMYGRQLDTKECNMGALFYYNII